MVESNNGRSDMGEFVKAGQLRPLTAYEKAYPGSTVTYKLTPINNDQFTAQITAAFASKAVPDAMLIYSGLETPPSSSASPASAAIACVGWC